MIGQLEAALPPRTPLPKFPKSTLLEEVEMSDLDARQQQAHINHGDAMDEDDEQPRVQCAQQ
jgi:DnaJ family protein A protein 2